MQVFLSYTSNKDEFGEVALFRQRLQSELRNFDPSATVFQDSAAISPGEQYPKRLEEELKRSDVLLIHLSPAWFKSEWCRREYNIFISDPSKLNKIIPLLVVSTSELLPTSQDEIAAKLSLLEYVDIRELRHDSWDSTEKRKYVAKLADRVNDLISKQSGAA
jgi:cobaltochelatase CobT